MVTGVRACEAIVAFVVSPAVAAALTVSRGRMVSDGSGACGAHTCRSLRTKLLRVLTLNSNSHSIVDGKEGMNNVGELSS